MENCLCYPIYKKGRHHPASNYRPVSLTSTVVKVMESIMNTNVLEHLTSNNIPSIWIFKGSLMHHSTTPCDGFFNKVT